MKSTEFDKFAEEYADMLSGSIRASGEKSEYFAEYKVRHVANVVAMREIPIRTVLDFGCGIGASVPYFRNHFPNANLACVDVSQKSIDIAQSRFPTEASYHIFDGQSLPFEENSFDIVFAACVFHHIPATAHVRLLHEIRRILAPNGVLFIFEHNPFNPLTVRVVNQCPFDENAALISSHDLTQRLNSADLRLIGCHYQIFFPNFLRILRRFEEALYWIPLGAQYCLTARK